MKRRNILRAAAAGRSLGVCVCTAGFVLGPLIAAVPAVQAAPLMEAGQENQASRNLRQLRDEVEWRRLEGEVNSLEAQRREAAPPPAAQEPTVPAGAFRFRLEAVTHTPSAILSGQAPRTMKSARRSRPTGVRPFLPTRWVPARRDVPGQAFRSQTAASSGGAMRRRSSAS